MKHNVEAFKKYYINATKEEVIEDMFLDNCNLQQEIERLHSIIKEARKYIQDRYDGEVLTHTFDKDNVKELKEILDKAEENK